MHARRTSCSICKTFWTHKTEKWCVAAIDVEHFRLYNELYGTEQGNTLLNTLASHLLDYQKTSGCPVGYWGNDDFSSACRMTACSSRTS